MDTLDGVLQPTFGLVHLFHCQTPLCPGDPITEIRVHAVSGGQMGLRTLFFEGSPLE